MQAHLRAPTLAIALILAACPKGEPAKPAEITKPKPETEPARTATTAAVSAPITFGPLTEPRRYTVREVMVAQLADKAFGGHKLTLEYSLKAAAPKSGEASAVALIVERVELDGKREDYKAKLSSTDAGNMHRVKNGADTLVAFESVWPFALLENPIEVGLDARGAAVRIEGGDAARKTMIRYHPANSGADPRNQRRVTELMSDQKLIELLLPAAAVLPKDGEVVAGRRIDVDRKESQFDYLSEVAQATLLKANPGGVLRVHTKRSESSVEGIGPADLGPKDPQITLINSQGDQTIDFAVTQPAFDKAASIDKRTLNYRVERDGKMEDLPLLVEVTRIWERR